MGARKGRSHGALDGNYVKKSVCPEDFCTFFGSNVVTSFKCLYLVTKFSIFPRLTVFFFCLLYFHFVCHGFYLKTIKFFLSHKIGKIVSLCKVFKKEMLTFEQKSFFWIRCKNDFFKIFSAITRLWKLFSNLGPGNLEKFVFGSKTIFIVRS